MLDFRFIISQTSARDWIKYTIRAIPSLIVVLNCLSESSAFAREDVRLDKYTAPSVYAGSKPVLNMSIEGNKNILSQFVKFFPFVSPQGEMIASPESNKKCDNSESWMRNYIDKQIVQCFFAFIIAVVAYSVVGCFLVLLARWIYYGIK
ncbi:MAG: hypothetical protein HIU83_11455 [Proteobacteria bacterium]|nr:hypothetical protein [Pseudomonadota bacterium]